MPEAVEITAETAREFFHIDDIISILHPEGPQQYKVLKIEGEGAQTTVLMAKVKSYA